MRSSTGANAGTGNPDPSTEVPEAAIGERYGRRALRTACPSSGGIAMTTRAARAQARNPEPETVFLVVAYDISDDRRRARMHALLLGFGTPVQESVFECELRPAQVSRLKARVRRLARPSTDRVAFYTLCSRCRASTEGLAGPRPHQPPAIVV